MRLIHNMNSLLIYKNYKTSVSSNETSVANLSSGKKLNSAKDNPNKIAESDRIKINILSRNIASQNAQDTSSMLQTFDGALQEMNNNVARLKELTVKAGSGSNNDEDCKTIQTEIDSIINSMNDLAKNTSFNGINLSHSNSAVPQGAQTASKNATIGALENESIEIPFFDVTTKGLGLDNIKVSGSTKNVDQSIKDIDAATVQITSMRSKYGSMQTRLDATQNDNDEISETLSSAQSGLEDADIGTEALENSRTQILIRASTSLMAQSNQLPQDALNILSSIR